MNFFSYYLAVTFCFIQLNFTTQSAHKATQTRKAYATVHSIFDKPDQLKETSSTTRQLTDGLAVWTPLPGRIEAESYVAMQGVNTQATTDTGGGLNVGWIDDNDWMDYTVSVATAGLYTVTFRIANGYGNGRIELRTATGAVLLGLDVPKTGGFQSWQSVSATATLPAGNQTLRVYAVRGLWNFNRMDVARESQTVQPTAIKIPIEGARWYQLNNTSNGLDGLFDGKTDATVNTGWSKILTNFDAYYPLAKGESMTIESIKLYSGQGTAAQYPLTLSIITDQWQRIPIGSFVGGQYNTWMGPYPSRQPSGDARFKLDTPIANARYLVINTTSVYPNEIEFYGSYTAGAQTTPVPAKSVQLKNMFGVNAFEWNFEHPSTPTKIDETRWAAAKYFTGVRHYMDWQKLELTEGSYTYNPCYSGGWNYDAIYERCKAEGKVVLACLKTLPGWMINTYPDGQRDSENVPVRYGKDITKPESYIEQARIAFQYAARYGSNRNVDPTLLSVNSQPRWTNDPPNTVKIGLDLIKYIECDNERDKWWKGRKAYQTGREYAANMSAFYDGHKNTMGRGIGIKNADPNMIVVMGGLGSSTMGADYVAGMIDWCKQFRGYKADGKVNLCWDVINYHIYPDNGNSSQSGTNTRGVAPEIGVAATVAKKFLKLAHDAAYDMPVWVTETGYDVNQGSPLRAIPIGAKTASQTQADWILRNSLLYARLGIDKLFFYQMYSTDPTSQTRFGSQGLINPDRTPTLAATYLYQTNKLLGEYRYKQTLNADPIVDRYELNGQPAYALVVPDEKGRTASYTLSLGSTVLSANVYTPKAGSTDMAVQTRSTTNGNLTLTVTETPIFVIPNTGSGRVGQEVVEEERDHSLATVQLYPNPAVEEVSISLTNASMENVEVTLYDANQGQIYQQHSLPKTGVAFRHKLAIDRLPVGLYMVVIRQGGNNVLRKLIKVQ